MCCSVIEASDRCGHAPQRKLRTRQTLGGNLVTGPMLRATHPVRRREIRPSRCCSQAAAAAAAAKLVLPPSWCCCQAGHRHVGTGLRIGSPSRLKPSRPSLSTSPAVPTAPSPAVTPSPGKPLAAAAPRAAIRVWPRLGASSASHPVVWPPEPSEGRGRGRGGEGSRQTPCADTSGALPPSRR